MAAAPPAGPLSGLSLFIELRADADAGAVYRTNIRRTVEAEALGFESLWVATRHFGSLAAGLPSALPFLAALTQATSRIRLGTAVIPISFENPIRLAEDAGIVDHLGGGRLELGVGKGLPAGLSSQSFRAFNLDKENREAIYAEALAGLKAALGGSVDAGTDTLSLYPPTAAILDRIWQATTKPHTAAAIGRAGDGLQLNRSTAQGDPGLVQSELIQAYLDAYEGESAPRIGISRVVLPAADRASAVALYAADRGSTFGVGTGSRLALERAEDELIRQNAAFGSVRDILDKLNSDEAFGRSTNYLLHVPIAPELPEFEEALGVIATGIYPELSLAQRSAVSSTA